MALRLKGSYGLALLFTTGIVGWMATGQAVFSGQESDQATPPPAARAKTVESQAVRVAVRELVEQDRQSILNIRGRTEADTKVSVRSETTAIVRERFVSKGQHVKKGDLLCKLDEGSRVASAARAEAALAQAEFDLKAKETLAQKGFAAKTQIAALKAQRDAALAVVKEANLELDRINITAPIDGVVQGRLAEVGDQLKAGDICSELMNPNPMLVVGQVSEREVQLIKTGTKADVALVTGEKLEGTVRYVSTTSDSETRTFLVEVEIPNPDGTVRDGVTAVAKLALPPVKVHQMSPAHLTLSDKGEVGVMLVTDGVANFTPVNIIAIDNDGVWLSGLPKKATVITVGQEYVLSGQPVEAVDEKAYQTSQATQASKSEEMMKGEGQ